MGQVLHGSATTRHAIRALIQRSQAWNAALSRDLGLNVKTIAKWRNRGTGEDTQMGPKQPRSSVLKRRTNKLVHFVALTLYWALTFPSTIDSIVSELALKM